VIGVLCVELFATTDGKLVVNEIAPRPHNSGHLTIDACRSSQFEQQFRAVSGLASGNVEMRSPAAMANLLGDHLFDATPECWSAVFAMPNVHVHMYGKAEGRTGRKMGHLTATAATAVAAEDLVVAARRKLRG
jgi:5-(carboxyamino)imidazole ribonucleotide synthase